MFVAHFVGVRCVFRGCSLHYRKPLGTHLENPLAALRQTVSSRRGRFIVPAYMYLQQHYKPFEMPSRNVRKVFILCMLHIHYAKVCFLRHKSMVFGVQNPPFYIAKTPF